MARRKINTMAELASEIGVSRPTLSRYFRDPSSVRGSTLQRIRGGLETVDYVPNFFAMRMNRKSTGLVGVIVPHLNDLFFTSLLEAIDLAAMERRYTIIALSSHGDPAVEVAAIEKLLSMSADGAIVAPLGRSSDPAALGRLARGLPLVLVDSRVPGVGAEIDFVGTDNRQSIGLVTEYLCRTGSPPVFLGMPPINTNGAEREAAYVETMRRLGHDPHLVEGPAAASGRDFEALACRILEERFGQGHLAGATILAANDRLAIGAIRAAHRHGLLGREGGRAAVRIAGHDDYPLGRYMTPALTTVAQDVAGIGRESVAILSRRLGTAPQGAGPTRIAFAGTLKIRESA
jgi:DNA-binding LacI/PurR family transcriptional regulator